MKLDKRKPYATVSGVGENHVYEQDGKNFDGTGNEINKQVISITDIKKALTAKGIRFNTQNNNRKSLLRLLKVV